MPGQSFAGFANQKGWTGRVELIESKLTEPLHWKKPKRIFVNSMSDLFHEALPPEDIAECFKVMHRADWHEYLILTKRAERCAELMPRIEATFGVMPHCWIGFSAEDQGNFEARWGYMCHVAAAGWLTWCSAEPLIGPLEISAHRTPSLWIAGPRWIVVGGESGPGARPFDLAWARRIIADCKAAGVPVFMKQVGAKPFLERYIESDYGTEFFERWGNKIFRFASRKGGDPAEWPEDLRVRQFPGVR